jgi:transcriptional regulator with XRE-family HTH domain
MQSPSALAQYISERLGERHESADQFARRIGINASGFYRFLRGAAGGPQHRTLEKIAGGLDMSAAKLLAAVDAHAEVIDDQPEETVPITIRVPLSLRKRALGVAQDEDRTFSSIAVYALRRYVNQREREPDLERS